MPALWISLGVLLVLSLWIAAMYNRLVRARNHCNESWSGIDTELKRRYDLIPNLVQTVKGYASHENSVIESVVQARARAVASNGSPAAQAKDENALIGTLRQLFVVVENYPQLKANENFLKLQGELSNTEDRIQAARRFYNANVRDLNVQIETFPSNVIAGMFHFSQREFFEIENAAAKLPPSTNF